MRACIDNGSRQTFTSTPPSLFTEEEQRHHGFISDYYARYGGLPTHALLVENNMHLPMATGTVEYHAERLVNRGVYRAYAEHEQGIKQAFMQNDTNRARELLGLVYATIQSLDMEGGGQIVEVNDVFAQVWVEYQLAHQNPGALRGMSFGWSVLDAMTGGIRPGDVATIVARPGLGKSFTIMRAAVKAWQEGASVSMVSMEMTAVEMARRMISMEVGVNPDYLQSGRMSPWGEEAVETHITGIRGRAPFRLMVGDLSKSVADVDSMIREYAPDFVGIDASYLLKSGNQTYKGRRFENFAAVAEEVKGVALRRNKPILQTVQFNRTGSDEEMDLSQIMGTDVIGQVSSAVLGMRRGPAPFERTQRRYLLMKNRNGPDYLDFVTHFRFNPFNMDVVEEDVSAEDGDGNWNGYIGDQPTNDEWTGA